MDDVRLGRFVRLARRRRGWRQADLAARSGVSQALISLIERGHLDRVSIRILRRVLAALEASASVDLRWRGGALDRLLDEGHAALGERFGAGLDRTRWTFEAEVSYSIFGERGSIDILAWGAASQCLLVVEIKTELTSIESTLRKLDEKVRLAPAIAADRFGWRAMAVSSVLVLPSTSTARRRVAAHEASIRSKLPASTTTLNRWLRHPGGSVAGIVFLSDSTVRSTGSARSSPMARSRPF
jgi:transcriptional regulator with XRE-family HTH domain